ncbi:MAG: hypothetical protein ACC663_03275 [Gammaproteobacteria bacterium]
MQKLRFIRWHEHQLYQSFAWLISCLLAGFLFVSIIEFVGLGSSGALLIFIIVMLYIIGLGIIELFRRFWMRFSYAQACASAATCKVCGAYGLFEVNPGARPIYASCQKCDHHWVIGGDYDASL